MFRVLKPDSKASYEVPSAPSLYSRISDALQASFSFQCIPEYRLKHFTADAVIQQGKRVALIEVKTGDPDLLLPSSTPSQIQDYLKAARSQFDGTVVPVLVTNYTVPEELQKDLENGGVKILHLDSVEELAGLGEQVALLANLKLPNDSDRPK